MYLLKELFSFILAAQKETKLGTLWKQYLKQFASYINNATLNVSHFTLYFKTCYKTTYTLYKIINTYRVNLFQIKEII